MQKTPRIYFLYVTLERVHWPSFLYSQALLPNLDHFSNSAPKRTSLLFASLGMEITIAAHFKVLWRIWGTPRLIRHCRRAYLVRF